MMMRKVLLNMFCGLVVIAAGCSKTVDSKPNYEAAINDYYKAHMMCLWHEPKKFPVQAATSDEAKTAGYDALTDQGLLTRTTGEKRVFIVASKQVNNYDVSDKGRATWTQDPSQPGYGNFCYGHRVVTSIDGFSTANDSAGMKTASVNYHYKAGDVAPWANNAEMKTAFPDLDAALSATQAGQAQLAMTGDHWQVTR